MKFTIHITRRHVERAGLDNEHYEYDAPCDETIELYVADGKVHDDIAQSVYREYFRDGLLMDKVPKEIRKQLISRIKNLISDFDLWKMFEDAYHDELREKYEEEYDNE